MRADAEFTFAAGERATLDLRAVRLGHRKRFHRFPLPCGAVKGIAELAFVRAWGGLAVGTFLRAGIACVGGRRTPGVLRVRVRGVVRSRIDERGGAPVSFAAIGFVELRVGNAAARRDQRSESCCERAPKGNHGSPKAIWGPPNAPRKAPWEGQWWETGGTR